LCVKGKNERLLVDGYQLPRLPASALAQSKRVGLCASACPGAIAPQNSQIPESQVWARAKICVLINLDVGVEKD